MNYIDRLKLTNPQDIFSREYVFLARCLVDRYGDKGEMALREAIRLFGATRGQILREAHLQAGMKINLYNLFTYGDLPTDPRMRRNKIKLCAEARLSETLICALYDMWREMDAVDLGRIYCEEFHHAKFGTYARKAQTNITQTMTQGDDLCKFAVYLRPGNMEQQEKELSFDQYGGPEAKPVAYQVPSYHDGFARLTVLLVDAFYRVTDQRFGAAGIAHLLSAIEAFAHDSAAYLSSSAESVGLNYEENYLRENCPIPSANDEWWQSMDGKLHPQTKRVLDLHFLRCLI